MKNIVIAGLLTIFSVGVSSCTPPKNAEATAQNSPSIKKQIENGAFVVDVRTPEEFAAGSFKGAVNIPLDEVQNRISEFQGKPSVIVFCKSGNRSGKAKNILEENGMKNVTNGINVSNMEDETK